MDNINFIQAYEVGIIKNKKYFRTYTAALLFYNQMVRELYRNSFIMPQLHNISIQMVFIISLNGMFFSEGKRILIE